jgi:FkbM family methyltransferase
MSTQPCDFSRQFGTLWDNVAHALIPAVRTYIRYAPWTATKQSFWNRIVDPYFAWHTHEYAARTVFGSRMVGDTRDIIQQYIYYFGIWEPNLTRWMAQSLERGDTFIDVGANIGYYSLLASKLVGQHGTIVAIEASPETYKVLGRNLSLNAIRNVRAVNMAVYNSESTVRVFRGSAYEIGRSTIVENEALKRGFDVECEVDAAPLCAILKPEEMKNARLVKVDVEGAEWFVLQGIEPLLRSGRSDLELIIEIQPECLGRHGKRFKDLLDMMSDTGFYPYRLENDYSALSYLQPHTYERPQRIRTELTEEQTDVVFSRRDSEHL